MRCILVLSIALLGCATAPPSAPALEIEYQPGESVIRAHNKTSAPLRVYYGDVRQPQYLHDVIFHVRFRDRDERILNVGLPDGWFTPAIYSSQLYSQPRRAELVIPAGSFASLALDMTRFASAVNADAGREAGPCEVQVRLFGYRGNDLESEGIDARTGWMPGPCPGHARNAASDRRAAQRTQPAAQMIGRDVERIMDRVDNQGVVAADAGPDMIPH